MLCVFGFWLLADVTNTARKNGSRFMAATKNSYISVTEFKLVLYNILQINKKPQQNCVICVSFLLLCAFWFLLLSLCLGPPGSHSCKLRYLNSFIFVLVLSQLIYCEHTLRCMTAKENCDTWPQQIGDAWPQWNILDMSMPVSQQDMAMPKFAPCPNRFSNAWGWY